MASPPLATFATAALGVAVGVLLVVEVVGACDEVFAVALGMTVELAEVDGVFALVEIETTVTVEEGMDEVVVLEYDGPVESLMVVVCAPVPVMWNGCEYSDRVLLVSESMRKPYVSAPLSCGVQVNFPS